MKALFFEDFNNNYISEQIKEMYWQKLYDLYIKKDSVILDIGANVGIFTFYAYEKAKKIYSVEPSNLHFNCLKKMIDFNKMKNAVPVKLALSNEDGEATFYHCENTTMFSLSEQVAKNKKDSEIVEKVTFDTLLKRYNIQHVDFLKLDVEGEESKIVSSDTFRKHVKNIDVMVVEWHTWSDMGHNNFVTSLMDAGFNNVVKFNTEATVLLCQK